MKYRVTNKTRIPTDDIHTAILFCAPKGITDFTITVNNCETSVWNAHVYLWKDIPSTKFFIQKSPIKFPQMSTSRDAIEAGYYPICRINNRYEMLIYLFSHELRHIWQATVSKRDFFKNERKYYIDSNGEKYSTVYEAERDACQYAKKMLERYRKL